MAISPTKEQSFDARATFDKFTEEAGNKGKLLLEDAKRWYEEANLAEEFKKSANEFGELFKKQIKGESGMTFEQFKEFIEKFAKDVQFEVKEVINKLMASQEKK